MSNLNRKSNDEIIYYIKREKLYRVESGILSPTTDKEIASYNGKYSIILDDSYFFYVWIGKMTVSKSKQKLLIGNYLQSMFPQELYTNFAVDNTKDTIIALLYKTSLEKLIQDNLLFFKNAKMISTPFLEFTSKYNVFQFTDGEKSYEKEESGINMLSKTPEGTISVSDIWEGFIKPQHDIAIININKSRTGNFVYIFPTVLVAIIYILFLISGVLGILQEKKILTIYENKLNELYIKAGLEGKTDPYGLLLGQVSKKTAGDYKVSQVLSQLSGAVTANTEIISLSIKDGVVRIEGYTLDFTTMEELKTSLDKTLTKKVNIDESKQVTVSGISKIKFTIRYDI